MILLFENTRFRLVWIANIILGSGDIVFITVQGWLTWNITESPFWVGAVMGVGGLGMVLTVAIGGVLADRFPRRELVIASGLIRSAIAATLVYNVFADSVEIWHILTASFLFGTSDAIRAPAFIALVVDLVGRKRVLSANAANFAGFGMAGIIAPLIMVEIVNAFGIGWAYLLAIGTEITAAFILLAIDVSEVHAEKQSHIHTESPFESFKSGALYIFTNNTLRNLIILQLALEGIGWAHVSMLPVMAGAILESGVSGLGYLQSASFAGIFLATVIMSIFRDINWKGKIMLGGFTAFSILIIAFSISTHIGLSLVLLCLAYAFGAAGEMCLITTLQTSVPSDMRGRIGSFQAFAWSINKISSFYMGAIGGAIGVQAAIAASGGLMLIILLAVSRKTLLLEKKTP